MAQLPRGIQLAQHTNKDGTVTTSYRVRIVRKDFNADKRFDNLEEAKSFLALSKIKKGKELIYSITEEERKTRRGFKTDDFSINNFFKSYIDDYVLNREEDTELKRRSKKNILSFYKTIMNTEVPVRFGTIVASPYRSYYNDLSSNKLPFYMLDIREIKPIDINNYIRKRLADSMKPSSISRELTHISNVYKKIAYLDDSLDYLSNPVSSYDKDLLKNRNPKKEVEITKEDEEKFFELLQRRENKQIYEIAKISLLTTMRRSEIINLTFSQIHDNYIQLLITKSGKPRKVYIDKEAKEFLNSIPKRNGNRLFTYTIAGFDRVFRAFTARHKLEHIHFHSLRKMGISRKISQIGFENNVFLTEFIGYQSVSNFIKNHTPDNLEAPKTQAEAMKSFGHSFAQTTKVYFNMSEVLKKK